MRQTRVAQSTFNDICSPIT